MILLLFIGIDTSELGDQNRVEKNDNNEISNISYDINNYITPNNETVNITYDINNDITPTATINIIMMKMVLLLLLLTIVVVVEEAV